MGKTPAGWMFRSSCREGGRCHLRQRDKSKLLLYLSSTVFRCSADSGREFAHASKFQPSCTDSAGDVGICHHWFGWSGNVDPNGIAKVDGKLQCWFMYSGRGQRIVELVKGMGDKGERCAYSCPGKSSTAAIRRASSIAGS